MTLTPEVTERRLELTSYQRKVLMVPERANLALTGGRGSGKTRASLYCVTRHIEEQGAAARVWMIRQTFPGLVDLETEARVVLGGLFPGASYHGSRHLWSIPSGATVELGVLETEADFARWQGRSCSLLIVDEIGQFDTPILPDLMRSCLRAPEGTPTRMIVCANPAGAGSAWLWDRFFAHGTPDWMPFEDEAGARWVRAWGTLQDNEFIDRERYAAELRAATSTDLDLQRAWIEGDFTVQRGSYFSAVLGPHNRIEPWPLPSNPKGAAWWASAPETWSFRLAYDHGSSRPAVALLLAETEETTVGPDGQRYVAGSIVALDEVALVQEGTLNNGLRFTVPEIAGEIHRLCERWNVPAVGVGDAAIFAQHGSARGSLGDEFRRVGVRFRPSSKGDRVAGWERLRRMLAGAATTDEPGLYLSTTLRYTWQTLPTLRRNPRRPEDLDTTGPDHAADALRYGILPARGAELHVNEFPFGLARTWASELRDL